MVRFGTTARRAGKGAGPASFFGCEPEPYAGTAALAAWPLLAAEAPGAKWLSIGAMVVGVAALMWTLRRQLRRRAMAAAAELPTPAERLEAIRRETQTREGIEARTAELLELAQRLAAELDNKAARLERLMAEAEERARRLERAGRGGAAAIAGGDGAPAPDPVSRQIYELADQGLRPVEIARQLGQHTGKVELILALRSR